ncbi:hypothetical protein BCEP4_800011 [Burkholderia cepacia]|nr:hypothetical protein BCEP4_800011 [Burkholderia cepacia]
MNNRDRNDRCARSRRASCADTRSAAHEAAPLTRGRFLHRHTIGGTLGRLFHPGARIAHPVRQEFRT